MKPTSILMSLLFTLLASAVWSQAPASGKHDTTRFNAPGASSRAAIASPAQMNEVVLHSFNGTDGDYPFAGVIGDSAGNIYGTTSDGGTSGLGLVYKLDRSGNETVLYTFLGGDAGAFPRGL